MEWYVIVGVLLVGVALAGSFVDEIPLTLAVIYLGVGAALGPWGAELLELTPTDDAGLLELLAEGAVGISLFSAGLKLRTPILDREWLVPLRLAFVSMALTVGGVALLAWWLLDIPFGLAVLVGGVLAPTDPVLAAEVQVNDAWDRDRLRVGLTAEAGLNDGAAFPFVLLGLGLIGLHDLGPVGVQWLSRDLIAGTVGGLAVGGLIATAIGRAVLHLRRRHGHGLGLDGFLVLGILAIAYGAALAVNVLGFLAAFAAGIALRRIERRELGTDPAPEDRAPVGDQAATDETQAPAHLAHSLLQHNEPLERIAELGLVVIAGSMLAAVTLSWRDAAIALLLIGAVRPIAVAIGLFGSSLPAPQRALTGWFGLRGIGSLYYLAYVIEAGLDHAQAERLASLTLTTIALSIVIHGISVTPLLNWYRRRGSGAQRPSGAAA